MTRKENRSRVIIGGTLSLANLALVASLALAGLEAPAHAQGQNREPVAKTSKTYGCPSGWTSTKNSQTDNSMCFPQGSLAPKIYAKRERDACAPGYVEEQRIWCTTKGAPKASASSSGSKPAGEPKSAGSSSAGSSASAAPSGSASDRLVSHATIAKANPLDRCPLGYFSKSDMTVCTTRLSPAPVVRKNSGGCRPDEIDEWGLYCTANANAITRTQAENEAIRDFNAIYAANRGTLPAQGSDTDNYPSMVAAYGPRGGAQASNPAAATSAAATDKPASQSAQCQTGDASATGAAIGAAVGGQTGAALGGMLGGLGKKKKKAPGC